MKTSPGFKTVADFSRPLDFLFHCHQKIAASLEALRRATAELHEAAEPEFAETLATIDTVLIHLKTAGKKHTADEEESLFPRLRLYKDDVVSEVFEVLDQLEAQHKRAASIENSLSKLVVNLQACDTPEEGKLALFGDLGESLYDLYRPHIQMENEFVFPAAAEILSREDLHSMGREIFQRRQLKIVRSKS